MANVQGDSELNDKATSNPLANKIQKILSKQLEDDKELLDALKDVSSVVRENTLLTRRNLRGAIERRSLAVNAEFLASLAGVRRSLAAVHADVTGMAADCGQMAARLAATRRRSRHLLDETTQLRAEAGRLGRQQRLLGAFTAAFQLAPAELAALRAPEVTPAFFAALERAGRIHGDVQLLLQSGHQQTALEVMEQMSIYQEAAYERLYKWAQSRVRCSDTDINVCLTKAMACLQDRPVLFQYVMDEYCNVRRQLLVRAFIDALTSGGRGGTPRPIELHAHDPLRYVGDMLAWLHQATPSEREALQALLRECRPAETPARLDAALAAVCEAVCRPLRARLEQVLLGAPGAVVLHKVAGLIQFYRATIGQVVAGGALPATLDELQALGQRAALQALQAQAARLCERVAPPAGDLAPGSALLSALSLLREALDGGGVVESRRQQVEQTAACLLDPLMTALLESAAALSARDCAVYLLNCLHRLHTTLALYEYMEARLEALQAQLDAQLETLTSEQASSAVQSLGLTHIYSGLEAAPAGPLSRHPGLGEAAVRQFLQRLDVFLASPDMLALPQLRLLSSSAHRLAVQRRSAEVVSVIYARLHAAVHDPANEYAEPDKLMPRPPDQLKALLVV
ncbi:conserved oligomeric Golgi complex subunit 6-like [Pollicipes pollicipes]|uniref:conserved oligomeric Golgi complex subunit 6-like n=1 Tax=Pollicipes pollicipes TaxID=41117 RepID=UPI0018858477|nr:conserved oligomeric Golgi complex subunit 6-like [Pollicipes pollicipes]